MECQFFHPKSYFSWKFQLPSLFFGDFFTPEFFKEIFEFQNTEYAGHPDAELLCSSSSRLIGSTKTISTYEKEVTCDQRYPHLDSNPR
jgi:hypothetical protein